jgi:hypothetical protein
MVDFGPQEIELRLGKAQRAQHLTSLECPQAVFQHRMR